MLTFNKLKSIARKIPSEQPVDMTLAVLGDTATQLFCTAIRGYAYHFGVNIDIYEAEFNRIFEEILDKNSGLYKSNPDCIFIYMSSERLLEEFEKYPLQERKSFADKMIDKIKQQWSLIRTNCGARIIQTNFPENNDFIFGNYGAVLKDSYIFQLRKLNYLLGEAANENAVFVSDLSAIQNTVGREQFFSEKFRCSAHLGVSVESLPAAAKSVADIICAMMGRFKKCVVLDLDNTLWGGVIGDDGINNIQIGELGAGRTFSDFQHWLKELKKRGILLAVCSKNNEDTAKEPFLNHPDMVLRLDDFAAFIADWNDKANNIRRIQQTLNIGMDSMVFIDDNPFERNLVRELIPEITVPELPEDPTQYLSFLQSEGLFETASYSEEDSGRTDQYIAENHRMELMNSALTIDDYLESLEMVGSAKPFDEFNVPRISQLTQRSNQFNLRTIRYTEDEIKKISVSDKYLTLYLTLKDRFGDHGLIGTVILEKQGKRLFIDTWLMSCRVLKRGVEEFTINEIVGTALKNGFDEIVGEYIPTKKNSMVRDIYENMGFKPIGNNKFKLDVHGFKPMKCYITHDQ